MSQAKKDDRVKVHPKDGYGQYKQELIGVAQRSKIPLY